eukprot:3880099-Rhodomonas_salina.2
MRGRIAYPGRSPNENRSVEGFPVSASAGGRLYCHHHPALTSPRTRGPRNPDRNSYPGTRVPGMHTRGGGSYLVPPPHRSPPPRHRYGSKPGLWNMGRNPDMYTCT